MNSIFNFAKQSIFISLKMDTAGLASPASASAASFVPPLLAQADLRLTTGTTPASPTTTTTTNTIVPTLQHQHQYGAAPPSPVRSIRSVATSAATSALLEPQNPRFTTPAAAGMLYSRQPLTGGGMGGGGGYGKLGGERGGTTNMNVAAAGMLGLTEISARMNQLLAGDQVVRQ